MRRFGSRLGFAFLASCAIAAPLFTTTTTTSADAPVQAEYEHVVQGGPNNPTNAAKIFRWGREAWEDEFEVDRLHRRWKSNDIRKVNAQVGMLTLKAKAGDDSLWTTTNSIYRKYGRWEARVRVRDGNGREDGALHRIAFELIPVGQYRCGARNLTVASYDPNKDERVRGSLRNDNQGYQFNFERDPQGTVDEFHTFAVEIARGHVTWFVDKVPVATERRKEALNLGYFYRPRFRMESIPGQKMGESWMQMDWVRYYTLKRPNARSIAAPPMEKGYNTAPHSC